MGAIGAGLFLVGLGAILRWAVKADISWLRLDIVGIVMLLVGIATLVLGLIIYQNRRHGTVVTQRRIYDEPGEPEEEIIERTTYDEPPV